MANFIYGKAKALVLDDDGENVMSLDPSDDLKVTLAATPPDYYLAKTRSGPPAASASSWPTQGVVTEKNNSIAIDLDPDWVEVDATGFEEFTKAIGPPPLEEWMAQLQIGRVTAVLTLDNGRLLTARARYVAKPPELYGGEIEADFRPTRSSALVVRWGLYDDFGTFLLGEPYQGLLSAIPGETLTMRWPVTLAPEKPPRAAESRRQRLNTAKLYGSEIHDEIAHWEATQFVVNTCLNCGKEKEVHTGIARICPDGDGRLPRAYRAN